MRNELHDQLEDMRILESDQQIDTLVKVLQQELAPLDGLLLLVVQTPQVPDGFDSILVSHSTNVCFEFRDS